VTAELNIHLADPVSLFMKSGTVFHWRLFRTYTCMSLLQEGYKLHYRQMVAQLRINKEMCIFHNCFHYFIHRLYMSMPSDISQHLLGTDCN